MSREKHNKIINDGIIVVSDNAIISVHDKIRELMNENGEDNEYKINTRVQHIRYIEANLRMLSDADLPKVSKIIDDAIENEKANIAMYDTLLDILNNILVHLGMDRINDVVDFKDIIREDLANDDCQQLVLNFREKIIESGGKGIVGLYNGTNIKHRHLNVIKNICEKLGYNFVSTKKSKQINKNRTFTTCYSINKL